MRKARSLRFTVLPPFYQTWWFLSLAAAALIVGVGVAFRYRIAQLRQRNEQQQWFARQLLASREDERKRIAVELHDSLGQNLLVIKNRALLNAMTTTDEQGRTRFNEFSDAVSQTLEEVRTISHDLRPPHLDQLGLRTALVAMIEKVAASSTIRFGYEIDELDGIFSPADEILLYRIVQESLNNIIKHSGATESEIRATLTERSAGANCMASASIDDGSFDSDSGDTITLTQSPAGPYPLGTTSVTLTATDSHGASCSATATVTVVDDGVPTLTLRPAMNLRPPNHTYQTLTMSQMVASVSDGCSSSLSINDVVIEKVTSDEPDNAPGSSDGNTINDIVITSDCKSVQLRTERDDTKNGRVYVITLRVLMPLGTRYARSSRPACRLVPMSRRWRTHPRLRRQAFVAIEA
jgi:two-component sensor histidine kinase